jgi:hypothetical protein
MRGNFAVIRARRPLEPIATSLVTTVVKCVIRVTARVERS